MIKIEKKTVTNSVVEMQVSEEQVALIHEALTQYPAVREAASYGTLPGVFFPINEGFADKFYDLARDINNIDFCHLQSEDYLDLNKAEKIRQTAEKQTSKKTAKVESIQRPEGWKQETWDALMSIVAIINNETDQSRRLWNVISALRGPDVKHFKTSDNVDDGRNYSDAYSIKQATTAVVRKAVGLSYDYLDVKTDREDYASLRQEMSKFEPGGHFFDHLTAAFSDLGLVWTDTNDQVGNIKKAKDPRIEETGHPDIPF